MIDLEKVDKFDKDLRNNGYFGFAEFYLSRCNQNSELNERIDCEVYKRLNDLDTKLGTTASEQLFRSLMYTTRWDIIKVSIYTKKENLKIFQDNRLSKHKRV